VAIALGVGLAGPGATAAGATQDCGNAHLRPTARNGGAIDKSILCLVDEIRGGHGLWPLRVNGALGSVAANQAWSMVSWDYYSDVRPSGQTPLSLVGVTSYPEHTEGVSVGQNIGWGTGSFTTPAHIVAAWMASPPHRANILSDEFRDAGVAVTAAVPGVLGVGRRGATYVFEFGVRRF
jgi:uncharacterized protein YkwD